MRRQQLDSGRTRRWDLRADARPALACHGARRRRDGLAPPHGNLSAGRSRRSAVAGTAGGVGCPRLGHRYCIASTQHFCRANSQATKEGQLQDSVLRPSSFALRPFHYLAHTTVLSIEPFAQVLLFHHLAEEGLVLARADGGGLLHRRQAAADVLLALFLAFELVGERMCDRLADDVAVL